MLCICLSSLPWDLSSLTELSCLFSACSDFFHVVKTGRMTSKFFSCRRWSWKPLCVFTEAHVQSRRPSGCFPTAPWREERCSSLVPGSWLVKCPLPPSFLPGGGTGTDAVNTPANGVAHRPTTVPPLSISLPLGTILSIPQCQPRIKGSGICLDRVCT